MHTKRQECSPEGILWPFKEDRQVKMLQYMNSFNYFFISWSHMIKNHTPNFGQKKWLKRLIKYITRWKNIVAKRQAGKVSVLLEEIKIKCTESVWFQPLNGKFRLFFGSIFIIQVGWRNKWPVWSIKLTKCLWQCRKYPPKCFIIQSKRSNLNYTSRRPYTCSAVVFLRRMLSLFFSFKSVHLTLWCPH